jgi:hypothetical protein
MPLRIVVDFNVGGVGGNGGPGGWSEVWWNSAGSLDGYVQLDASGAPVPGTPLANLLAVRLPMLSAVYAANHIRVTDTNPANGERSIDLPQNLGTGTYGNVTILGQTVTVAGGSAEIFAKLLLRMDSGPTRRRNIWIGGIPEEIVKAPTTYNPTPKWNGKLAAFSSLMTTGGYGIQGRPLRSAAVPITAFTTDNVTGRFAQVTPIPPLADLTGAAFYVVIRGIKQPAGWNGVHRAFFDGGGHTYIYIGPTRRTMRTVPVFAVGSGGTVQTMIPVFANTDRVRPIRIDKRGIGRPFGESRGRR